MGLSGRDSDDGQESSGAQWMKQAVGHCCQINEQIVPPSDCTPQHLSPDWPTASRLQLYKSYQWGPFEWNCTYRDHLSGQSQWPRTSAWLLTDLSCNWLVVTSCQKLPIDDVVVMLPVEECVDVSWPVMPVAGCICATLPAAKISLIITYNKSSMPFWYQL